MWKKVVAATLLAFALGVSGGCALFSPIGAGISIAIQLGVFWVNGEAHKYYNTDQQTTLVAVKAALKELEIPINDEEVKDDVITIRAGGKVFVKNETQPHRFGVKDEVKSEDRFKIRIEVIKPHTTRVSIRINNFGDKPYCEMIYRHIDAQPKIKQFVTLEELKAAAQ